MLPLEDYGFIGDLHTCALIGRNGSIDWLCVPRFDSGACVAALLGEEEHGRWQIAPCGEVTSSRQQYRDDTLILVTTFTTAEGEVDVIDFMPIGTGNCHVIRRVEGRRGRVKMRLQMALRFDYGRTRPWLHTDRHEVVAYAGANVMVLRSSVPIANGGTTTNAEFTVSAGERKDFIITWHASHRAAPEPIDAGRALADTAAYWTDWVGRCSFEGEWRDAVIRSMLTLKGLTFDPTGAIIAAGTTSLPEEIGGVRNWDYRYCWLRDATFTLYALMDAGYRSEAEAWGGWLMRAVAGDPSQLQMIYDAAGERRLTEVELDFLPGYEKSRPVRIGNAAAEQFQLDVYGEVVGALHLARSLEIPLHEDAWKLEREMVEFVIGRWRKPDEGIWEIRGKPEHFTHSKVMAWVALDRAIESAEAAQRGTDLSHWKRVRKEIHEDVCRQGYHAKRGAFTQIYGAEPLDAALLMLPLVGFLPAEDPRIVGTVEAIQRELNDHGFIRRYDTRFGIDGLPGSEGAFLPCSFWMVDCLHLLRREDEARELFQQLLEVRTPLGLLSEAYDIGRKRLVGNFPQVFSHVGLINSAQMLTEEPHAHAHPTAERYQSRPHRARPRR